MIDHVRRIDSQPDQYVPIWLLNQRIDEINQAIDQINWHLELPTPNTETQEEQP